MTAYRFVRFGVSYTASDLAFPSVDGTTAPVIGAERLDGTIDHGPLLEVDAAGALAVGDLVTADSAGKAAKWTSGVVVGQVLKQTYADGDRTYVMLGAPVTPATPADAVTVTPSGSVAMTAAVTGDSRRGRIDLNGTLAALNDLVTITKTGGGNFTTAPVGVLVTPRDANARGFGLVANVGPSSIVVASTLAPGGIGSASFYYSVLT